MLLKKQNPTIREVCKALDSVVSELLEKHGKVSNPDFEKELEKITGIGYKQLKNYKNHPKPDDKIKDNAKILKFALEKCPRRSSGKLIPLLIVTIIACLGLIYKFAIQGSMKTTYVPYSTLVKEDAQGQTTPSRGGLVEATEVFFTLPKEDFSIKLGLMDDNFPLSRFQCTSFDNQRNCLLPMRHKSSSSTLTLGTSKGQIIRITLISTNYETIKHLDQQLRERIIPNMRKVSDTLGDTQIYQNDKVELILDQKPAYLNIMLRLIADDEAKI